MQCASAGRDSVRRWQSFSRPNATDTEARAEVAGFGHPVLRSDASHPDAAGYALIADGLLEVLESTPALISRVTRRRPERNRGTVRFLTPRMESSPCGAVAVPEWR
jgi:hypothetical protein